MSEPTVPQTRIRAEIRADGSGVLDVNGTHRHLERGPFPQTRTAIVSHAAEFAQALRRPIGVAIGGADGHWEIVVHPDGSVTDVRQLGAPSEPAPLPSTPPLAEQPAAASEPAPAFGQTGVGPEAPDATLASRDELPEAAHGAVELPPTHAAASAPAPQPSPALPAPVDRTDDAAVAHHAPEVPQASPAVPLHAPIASVPGYDPLLDETVTRPPATATPIASVPNAPVTAQPGSTPAEVPAVPAAAQHEPESRAGYAPGELSSPMTADGRHSFLEAAQREAPAQSGLRGAMTRMGLRMAPSQEELAARADERAVSQHWPGPRTIAVVNGKGGAGKTPTTVLLSAVFAHFGGAGVLAWDNNQTRGTLGWRTERGPHEATLLELLPQAERLLSVGAQAADLASFVHHQSQDKFDVLRSKPMRLAHENRVSPADVDAIHAIASKYYRIIVIDSGNDESDPMWLRMIDHADQIVVATTTRADHAEAGALLLEALAQRDERSAILAKRSVVVVSQADPKASRQDVDSVIGGYGPLAREVVRIPFDQALVDGHLRLGSLRPETRRSWLTAAAAVARGL